MRFALLLLCVTLVVTKPANGVDLTLLPVGPFGEPLNDCKLRRFTQTDRAGNVIDARKYFHGLRASEGIEPFLSDVRIECAEGEVSTRFEVLGQQGTIYVMPSTTEPFIADHRKGKLEIQVEPAKKEFRGWYLRLSGLLNDESRAGLVNSNEENVRFSLPETGLYPLIAQSIEGGKSCLFIVDISAFSKLWRIALDDCKLKTDQGAVVLSSKPRRSPKEQRWINKVQDMSQKLSKDLLNAAEKTK